MEQKCDRMRHSSMCGLPGPVAEAVTVGQLAGADHVGSACLGFAQKELRGAREVRGERRYGPVGRNVVSTFLWMAVVCASLVGGGGICAGNEAGLSTTPAVQRAGRENARKPDYTNNADLGAYLRAACEAWSSSALPEESAGLGPLARVYARETLRRVHTCSRTQALCWVGELSAVLDRVILEDRGCADDGMAWMISVSRELLRELSDTPTSSSPRGISEARSGMRLDNTLANGLVRDWKTTEGLDYLFLACRGYIETGADLKAKTVLDWFSPTGADKPAELALIDLALALKRGEPSESHLLAKTLRHVCAADSGWQLSVSNELNSVLCRVGAFSLSASPDRGPYVHKREEGLVCDLHMVPLSDVLKDLVSTHGVPRFDIPENMPPVIFSTDNVPEPPLRLAQQLASEGRFDLSVGEGNRLELRRELTCAYWYTDTKFQETFSRARRVTAVAKDAEAPLDSGYLIVDGHFVGPPYSVTAKGQAVLINGCVAISYQQAPEVEEERLVPKEVGAAASYLDIHAIVNHQWPSLRNEHGVSKGIGLLAARLRKEPFLKSVESTDNEVRVTYDENNLKNLEASFFFGEDVPRAPDQDESHFVQRAAADAEKISSSLRSGGLVFIVDNGITADLSPRDAGDAMLQTNHILSTSRDRRVCQQALSGVCGVGWGQDQAGYLIANFEHGQRVEDLVVFRELRPVVERALERVAAEINERRAAGEAGSR